MLIKFLSMGDTHSVIIWLVGAMFVSSMALDFVGLTSDSLWQMYLGLSLALIAVSALTRRWQMKRR